MLETREIQGPQGKPSLFKVQREVQSTTEGLSKIPVEARCLSLQKPQAPTTETLDLIWSGGGFPLQFGVIHISLPGRKVTAPHPRGPRRSGWGSTFLSGARPPRPIPAPLSPYLTFTFPARPRPCPAERRPLPPVTPMLTETLYWRRERAGGCCPSASSALFGGRLSGAVETRGCGGVEGGAGACDVAASVTSLTRAPRRVGGLGSWWRSLPENGAAPCPRSRSSLGDIQEALFSAAGPDG